MAKLVTLPEMLAIEKAADASGLSYGQMMDNAGKSFVKHILAHSQEGQNSIFALVGKGNNGGDALVALAELLEMGWSATAYLVADRDGDPLLERFTQAGGLLILHDAANDNALRESLAQADVFVDALLGTGIQLPLRDEAAALLASAKQALADLPERPLIVALDCPSGMDCQSGELAPQAIPADLTVCMAAVKVGMLTLPAFDYLGRLEVGDIGLPADLKEWAQIDNRVIDEREVAAALPDRSSASHKGTFGRALIVAGSPRYPGAALLSARAAARSGAGLVTLAASSHLQSAIAGHVPEVTWLPLAGSQEGLSAEHLAQLQPELPAYNALLLGPGLGDHTQHTAFLEGFLAQPNLPPLVVDADALRFLASQPNGPGSLSSPAILTPHPGEFAALTGLSKDQIQADRIALAGQYAREWGHILVLKGALTVVANPEGHVAVIPVAHPALATAGSGDVLAGAVTGLLAQGMPPYEAAYVGAWAHALAGRLAAEYHSTNRGILAGDLLEFLPELLAK